MLPRQHVPHPQQHREALACSSKQIFSILPTPTQPSVPSFPSHRLPFLVHLFTTTNASANYCLSVLESHLQLALVCHVVDLLLLLFHGQPRVLSFAKESHHYFLHHFRCISPCFCSYFSCSAFISPSFSSLSLAYPQKQTDKAVQGTSKPPPPISLVIFVN